jgi:hypothetical protein
MRAAERYTERVALLVRVLPLLADEEDFALKGGTARPIAEVLEAHPKDLRATFRTEFEGMTSMATTATIENLMATRTALVRELVDGMPRTHRAFLAGFKRGDPDWDLTGVPQIRDLPAVRWKQANLDRMTPNGRARAVERLEAVLGLPQG